MRACVCFIDNAILFSEFCSVARFCAVHSQSYAIDGNKYCDVKLMFCYCTVLFYERHSLNHSAFIHPGSKILTAFW